MGRERVRKSWMPCPAPSFWAGSRSPWLGDAGSVPHCVAAAGGRLLRASVSLHAAEGVNRGGVPRGGGCLGGVPRPTLRQS